jgi:hypothetical protein
MKHQIVVLSYILVTLASYSATTFGANQEDVLRQKLSGRTGDASQDDRSRNLLGCTGNTFAAGVSLQNVSVTVNGDIADVYTAYSGKYTRQGWNNPCVQGGHEDRSVSGKAHFTIKQVEVNDPGHDSNRFAEMAAKNAVRSAGIPIP